MANRTLWIASGAAGVFVAFGLVVTYVIVPASAPTDALPGVAVGTLTVTQPYCEADDPGGDGILLVEGAGDEVAFEVEVPNSTAAAEILYPGEPFTVLVDDDPVTVIVTPVAHAGWEIEDYTADDWVVTLVPLGEKCA